MKQKTLSTFLLSSGIVALSTIFTSSFAQTADGYADVLHVEEIKEMVDGTREVCQDVVSTEPAAAPKKNNKKILGTAAGVVVGGLLGNQIGGGSGKKLATIAGATAGGMTGNKMSDNGTPAEPVTKTEQKCRVETGPVETVVGYNVTYKIGDKANTIRTNFKPGDRIPVKDGKLVFEH